MKAYLSIINYAGCGIHFYGDLRVGKETYNVERLLTAREAKQFNIEDRRNGYQGVFWKAGSPGTRFFDREHLIEVAVEICKAKFPEVTLLIEGANYICEPQRVLMGPEPLKTELNKLVDAAEACGWWDNEPVMELLCAKFDELSLEQYQ